MQVLWDIDFEGILDGFWEGVGKPKSIIFFVFFREIKKRKQKIRFGEAKKSHFEASRANCGRSAAVRAGPGEGTKGWGKALEVGI